MKTNKASLAGLLLCFLTILFGLAANGGISEAFHFIHFPSLVVTIGGSFFAVLITADSFYDFILGLSGIKNALTEQNVQNSEIMEQIYELSEIARREGLLALEEQSGQLTNAFLKKGIILIVDGTDPELIRDILEAQMDTKQKKCEKQIHFWQDLGAYAPAWGMLGTLIGLINMMNTMGTNPSAIGSGMSLALITTLYGSILANWICIPVARRLEKKAGAEYLSDRIVVEGVLSIQAGENTRIIKEKMRSFVEEEMEVRKLEEE